MRIVGTPSTSQRNGGFFPSETRELVVGAADNRYTLASITSFRSPHAAMTIPSRCPKCQARFPESIERFGTNFVCLVCGQIQRVAEPPPVVVSQTLTPPEPDVNDNPWSAPQLLPPLDRLLTEGWQLFRERIGLCLGTFVVWVALKLVAMSPAWIADNWLQTGQLTPGEQSLVAVGQALATLGQLVLAAWLDIGFTQLLLKVVRGDAAELRDLFRGGPFLGRALLCLLALSVLLAVAFFVGLIPLAIMKSTLGVLAYLGMPLSLIPTVIVYLVFWPYLYVLVDRDLPGLVSLHKAAEITFQNRWSLARLFGLCGLFWLFGLMAAGVGLLIAVPYTFVVSALAYDGISGLRRSHGPSEADEDEVD